MTKHKKAQRRKAKTPNKSTLVFFNKAHTEPEPHRYQFSFVTPMTLLIGIYMKG